LLILLLFGTWIRLEKNFEKKTVHKCTTMNKIVYLCSIDAPCTAKVGQKVHKTQQFIKLKISH